MEVAVPEPALALVEHPQGHGWVGLDGGHRLLEQGSRLLGRAGLPWLGEDGGREQEGGG
jgi:hypothetical protein